MPTHPSKIVLPASVIPDKCCGSSMDSPPHPFPCKLLKTRGWKNFALLNSCSQRIYIKFLNTNNLLEKKSSLARRFLSAPAFNSSAVSYRLIRPPRHLPSSELQRRIAATGRSTGKSRGQPFYPLTTIHRSNGNAAEAEIRAQRLPAIARRREAHRTCPRRFHVKPSTGLLSVKITKVQVW